MEKVTTVLIGCGNRGVQGLGVRTRQSENLELLAACDVDAARLAAASQALGVVGERDYRRLLERRDVQSVLIATTAKWHAPIALEAIRAGKHVLVEKPLAETCAAAQQIVDAAEAAGVVGMVGYQLRFTPFAQALKREAALLTPMQTLVTRQRGPLNPQFFLPDHYSGILDHATHDIHLAMWLMEGIPTGVYGTVTRGTIQGDDTIEFVNLLIEYEQGRRTANVVGSMLGIQTPNVIQVVGMRGSATSLDRRMLQIVRHEGVTGPGVRTPVPGLERETIDTTSADAGQPDEATTMLDHFADLIAGGTTQQQGTTLREGMHAVAVTEAMVRATQTGCRVSLDAVGVASA